MLFIVANMDNFLNSETTIDNSDDLSSTVVN